jgi:hypothetical protein
MGGVVAQRRAYFVDGRVDAVFRINEHTRSPEPVNELLTGHELSGMLSEKDEQLHRDLLEAHDMAAASQLVSRQVENRIGTWCRSRHLEPMGGLYTPSRLLQI